MDNEDSTVNSLKVPPTQQFLVAGLSWYAEASTNILHTFCHETSHGLSHLSSLLSRKFHSGYDKTLNKDNDRIIEIVEELYDTNRRLWRTSFLPDDDIVPLDQCVLEVKHCIEGIYGEKLRFVMDEDAESLFIPHLAAFLMVFRLVFECVEKPIIYKARRRLSPSAPIVLRAFSQQNVMCLTVYISSDSSDFEMHNFINNGKYSVLKLVQMWPGEISYSSRPGLTRYDLILPFPQQRNN